MSLKRAMLERVYTPMCMIRLFRGLKMTRAKRVLQWLSFALHSLRMSCSPAHANPCSIAAQPPKICADRIKNATCKVNLCRVFVC